MRRRNDPDGDGISNLGEYLFGRNPTWPTMMIALAITMVDWSVGSIDTSLAETVELSYVLDRHAYVTINFPRCGYRCACSYGYGR